MSESKACLCLVRLSVWIVGWPTPRGLINMENSVLPWHELAVLDVLGTLIEPEPICPCRTRPYSGSTGSVAELWSAEHGHGERGRCRDRFRCESANMRDFPLVRSISQIAARPFCWSMPFSAALLLEPAIMFFVH